MATRSDSAHTPGNMPVPVAPTWRLRVRLWPDDPEQDLVVAPGQTLLQAMLAQGVEWPRSCRNGTCRTCLGRLGAGQVRHTVEWPGLSAEEKAEGCVLPCVAVPLGNVSLLPP